MDIIDWILLAASLWQYIKKHGHGVYSTAVTVTDSNGVVIGTLPGPTLTV